MENNMKISETLLKFSDWLRFKKQVREGTVKYYEKVLNVFMKEMGDLEIKHIKKETFWEWQRKMKEQNKSQTTQRFYILFLRVFLRFCKEERLTNIDINEIAIPQKPPKKEVIYLGNGEVNKFANSIKGLKFRTIVELLLGSGMRISELLSLKKDDIKNGEVKIVSKGRERTVLFSERALSWLEKYLKKRKDNNPFLFPGKRKQILSSGIVEGFFQKHCKEIGIEKRITPHTLRKTFGTNLLMNGANLFYVQNLLGHADIKTTAENYLGIDWGQIKKTFNKCLNYEKE